MTTFEDYLRDLHKEDCIDQDFADWVSDIEADKLGTFFMEYLSKISSPRKIGKIAYIVLENQ